MDNQKVVVQKEVVIIGAGAAGIGAALRLKKQNVPFIVLEARNRIGGRVLTELVDGVPIDVGASWIHSYGQKNPLRPLIRQNKIQQVCLSKRKGGRIYIDGQKHQQFPEQILQCSHITNKYLQRLIEKNLLQQKKDISIYEAIKDYLQNTVEKCTSEEKRCTYLLINMIQHYEGSSIKQLSATNYEFREDSGGDFMPEGGYGAFLTKIWEKAMGKDDVIRFGRVVDKIQYSENGAFVHCKNGQTYSSKKLISSLPLGVLKASPELFTPPLPNPYQLSIKNLGFGLMDKIIVSFTQQFWDPVSWLSIGCNERGKFSHTLNISQKGKNILCCFITDDYARKMQKEPDQKILEEFVGLLERIYQGCCVKVKDFKIVKWGSQEFSRGSYSSFHVGSAPEDCYQLRTPIMDTLWIVGEHCYAEHIGTAHGAFRTGEWASEQILKSLKWVNPILKQPKTLVNKKP